MNNNTLQVRFGVKSVLFFLYSCYNCCAAAACATVALLLLPVTAAVFWLISSQHANKFLSRQAAGGGESGQPATGYKPVNMNKTLGRQFTCVGTASQTHSRWLTHTHTYTRTNDTPTQIDRYSHTNTHMLICTLTRA